MAKFEESFTKGELARYVAQLGVIVSRRSQELAEGMWNPLFVNADATDDARRLDEDVSAIIRHLKRRMTANIEN